MSDANPRRPGALFSMLLTAAALYAALGLLDLRHAPYSGLTFDGINQVRSVAAASPAERAGFQPGDIVRKRGDVDTSNVYDLFLQARTEIGSSRDFLVERDGEEITLGLQPSGLRARQFLLNGTGAAVALVFLLSGWTALGGPTTGPQRLLPFLGLLALLIFVPPPYFTLTAARALSRLIPAISGVCFLAILLHYLLLYPRRRRLLASARGRAAIYAPVVLFAGLCLAGAAAGGGLFNATRAAAGVVPLLYLLAIVGSLLYSLIRSDAPTRRRYGLWVLAAAFVVALAPVIVAIAVPSLPAAAFYFASLSVLPMALVWTSRRSQADPSPTFEPRQVTA